MCCCNLLVGREYKLVVLRNRIRFKFWRRVQVYPVVSSDCFQKGSRRQPKLDDWQHYVLCTRMAMHLHIWVSNNRLQTCIIYDMSNLHTLNTCDLSAIWISRYICVCTSLSVAGITLRNDFHSESPRVQHVKYHQSSKHSTQARLYSVSNTHRSGIQQCIHVKPIKWGSKKTDTAVQNHMPKIIS